EDVHHLVDFLRGSDLPQADLLRFIDGNQNTHVAVEDAQYIEALDPAADLLFVDADDLSYSLCRIDRLVTYLELAHAKSPPRCYGKTVPGAVFWQANRVPYMHIIEQVTETAS